MNRPHLPPLLIWTLVCVAFFATILLGLERLPSSDFSGQFHTFAAFQAREMLSGNLPLWSPGSYGGFPFAADPQSAVFYLPRWLTIFATQGMTYHALEVEAIAHIWLAGIFTYALAYHITKQRVAALFAAIAFALGGYLTSYPILQLAVLETIVWLPLALFFVRIGTQTFQVSTKHNPLPPLIAAAITLALSLTAGHPQTFLHLAYLTAIYYFFRAWQNGWSWRATFGRGAMIGLLTLALSAPAWLPALRYAPFTQRGTVDYAFVSGGQPLLNYLQTLIPGVLAFWSPEFIGLGTFSLALLAWFGRRLGNHAEIIFWSLITLLSAWLALGDRGILFQLIYTIAPGFSQFRQQERLISLTSLSTALLAAQGLALWLKLSHAQRHDLLKKVALTSGSLLLIAALTLALTTAIHHRPWLPIWVRQAGFATLILLFLSSRRDVPLARLPSRRTLILVGLLAIELYIGTFSALDRRASPPTVFWPEPTWTTHLPVPYENPTNLGRIDTQNIFHANVGELFGWEDVKGISPLRPTVLGQMEKLPRPVRWQLLNVTHTLSYPHMLDTEPLNPLEQFDGGLIPDQIIQGTVYELQQPFERAWLVYQTQTAPDAESAFEMMREPSFDPGRTAILHPPLPAASRSPLAAGGQSEVNTTRLASNKLEITITTDTPGLLVISEWNYPGWQAHLNGQRVPIYPTNYALIGLDIPAGTHTLTLHFLPPDILIGLATATLALLTIITLLWKSAISDQRSGINHQPPTTNHQSPTPHTPHPTPHTPHPTLLILLAFLLRLFTTATQELRGDEAFSYTFARLPFNEILPALIRQGDPHSPAHYLLLHGWMQLVGKSEIALRYLSIIPGLLLLPLMYQLGRKLSGRGLGLLLLLLTTLSQSQIWISQDVRNQYTWATLFSVAATLWLLQLAKRQPNWSWDTIWRWAIYALLCALTVYAHYYGGFALIGHGLYLLVSREQTFQVSETWKVSARRIKQLITWLASGLGALLLFTPWLLTTWQNLSSGQLTDPGAPDLTLHLVSLGRELLFGNGFDHPAGRWLLLITVGLALYGAHHLWQTKPGWAIMLLGWLGSAALAIYLIRFQRATFNTFYITPAAPAWWLLVAVGLKALYTTPRLAKFSKLGKSLPAIALTILILLPNLISLKNYYTNPTYNRNIGYRPLATHIATHMEPNDVFIANFPDPALTYYIEDLPLPRLISPTQNGEPAGQTHTDLAHLTTQHNRLWFVPAQGANWDSAGTASNWLMTNTVVEWDVAYDSLHLQAFRPGTATTPLLYPINQSLDTLLTLQGATLTVNGQPVPAGQTPLTLTPNDTLHVTLLWQALSQIPDSYTVFVHLLAPDGFVLTQHDGIPVNGTRHTNTWQPGEQIIDRHELVIPAGTPPQPAQLIVGLYHSNTLTRQPFTNSTQTLLIVPVTLTNTEETEN